MGVLQTLKVRFGTYRAEMGIIIPLRTSMGLIVSQITDIPAYTFDFCTIPYK